jgi:hypothetical protein
MIPLINWELIREPYNWAFVVLVLMFGLVLLHLLSPEEAGAPLSSVATPDPKGP